MKQPTYSLTSKYFLLLLLSLLFFGVGHGCYVSAMDLECRPCLPDGGCYLKTYQCDLSKRCRAINPPQPTTCPKKKSKK